MRRLAAVTAAAVLGSGCIFTNNSTSTGSVNVYWDFVRNAPAQTNGYVIYDQSLVGAVDGPCAESGVEVVVFDTPAGQGSVPCVYGGVQGVTIDGLDTGTRTVTLRGVRRIGGMDTVVFEQSAQVQVPDGGARDLYMDVTAVAANLDVVAYFDYSGGTYPSCDLAFNPEVDYVLVDGAGTTIEDVVAAVTCPGTVSISAGLPVRTGALDLDNYTIRMKGYTGAPAERTFDSCTGDGAGLWYAFDHGDDQSGSSGLYLDLFTPPACVTP